MGSSGEDLAFSAIGLTGGFLLAISALPQIHRTHTTRSSEDISYAYQLFLMTGLACFLLYYAYYRLWPVLVATSISLTFLTYLTGLKIYLENFASPKITPGSDGVILQEFTPGTALLPADQLAGPDERGREVSTTDSECSVGTKASVVL